jgi:ribosomal protein L37AE/L43A
MLAQLIPEAAVTSEKDLFGEKMKLVERAREDIYFAEKDRELLAKLKTRLKQVEKTKDSDKSPQCPKCAERLASYRLMGFFLDRCQTCGGMWLDRGELRAILTRVSRSPLVGLIDELLESE